VTEPRATTKVESRWGIALATFLVLLLTLLPGRVRASPTWLVVVLAIGLIVPLLALPVVAAKERWLRIERVTVLVFLVLVAAAQIVDLLHLLFIMLGPPKGISGLQLLNSSIALWATNVLMYSIIYWWIDRGGPQRRISSTDADEDWHFPRVDVEGASAEWRPTYVDYLFLAFCTATAFSPTEALPMTPRAKLLMMSESIISLITIVAIASRAIAMLG
jgi:hypothetical protein